MSLSEQLLAIQNQLAKTSSELAELQMEVQKLEQENERLRKKITSVLEKDKGTAGGRKALQQLYDEGYHVCPAFFGREHDGDCLYCRGVLENVTE